jgi:predicted lipase
MNNFMPSNLTSALYNQVNQRTSEYAYDINLGAVNKSLSEYNMGTVISQAAALMGDKVAHQSLYYVTGGKQ